MITRNNVNVPRLLAEIVVVFLPYGRKDRIILWISKILFVVNQLPLSAK